MTKPAANIPRGWVWHYRTLTRLRAALARDHDELAAAFRQPVERGGEDRIDSAEEHREHAELLGKLHNEEIELAEIDAALTRLHHGTYGICELTGEPIALERLRAIPWTRWSALAAAKLEHARRPPGAAFN